MTRRLGNRASGWRALTGSASAAATALGLLVCLCTLLAVVGPRAEAQVRTTAVRQVMAAGPATDKAVIGTVSDATLGAGQPQGLDAGLIERARAQLHANLATLPLSPARTDWSSLTTPFLAVTGYAPSAVLAYSPPQLELSYRDALARNVEVIAGRLPSGTARIRSAVVLQAAVTAVTARRFGLRVGSRLGLPGTSFVLAVTAIVQPREAAAPFWTIDPVVAAPRLFNPFKHPNEEFGASGQDGNPYAFWVGGVFIAADAVAAVQSQINGGLAQVTWVFPLALGRLTAAQATHLQPSLTAALSTAGRITIPGGAGGAPIPVQVALSSGTGPLIGGFVVEAAGVGSVLDLLSVSLAVLAAVVVLLAGWLVAEQRRQDFAVLRARGASRRQLALAVLAGAGVAVVPGAVAGAVVAVVLTPSSPVALSWWLAGPAVAAALAGPVAVTVRVHRGYAPVMRPDAPPARLWVVRRLIIEAGLVAGAAGGLAVLRYKGSTGDLYASAAPVLLAVGVAVVMVRIYPLVVLGMLRLRGQRASAATFLGLARAARASASAVLPAFALVLALALVSFAGMVRGAVQRGEVATSWQEAGADAVITEPGTVSAALARAVAAVPGVRHVAAAGVTLAGASSSRQFSLLAVDPGQYAALVVGSPLPQPPPAFTARARPGPVPALVSPGLAAQVGHAVSVLIGGLTIQVRVVGQAAGMSAVPDLADDYLVVSRQALGDAAPRLNTLLVGGPDLNRAALGAAVSRYGRGGTVVLRSGLLAGLQRAPLQRGAHLALALGAVAAACCGLLVLLLSLLLSASARRLALARMSTMGLSDGQARLLGLVELLPQLLAVLAGGLACAAWLVPLTAPALRLRIFTGPGASVPVRIETNWLAAAGGGLLVLAVVTLIGQTMLTDRTAGRSLRIGE
jgi:putative ABC transport system permease protein